MATLPHEGEYSVWYRSVPVSVGAGYRPGYLARPDRAGRFPTLILLPGIDGLGPQERATARRIARHGIAVLAVNLYPSEVRGDPLAAYAGLTDRQAITVVDETYDYLCSDDIDWALTDRVGLCGFDVGGRFALIQSAHRDWVGAVTVISTPLTGDEDRAFPVADMLGHLPQPVLGLYGADDELIANETVDEAQNRNTGGTWLLYDDARHDFMDASSEDYDIDAAEDALARMVGFFTQTLPAPEIEDLG